ncbi:MAG: hypothetical protein HKN26_04725 [Acidimicrobiales bacterium]|nr:hypothetical protein [Acidimicrobiales bacterium]
MEVLESLGQAVEEVAGRVKQAVIDLDPDRFGPVLGADGSAKKKAAPKKAAPKKAAPKKKAAKKTAAKKTAAKKPAAKKTAGPTKAELYDQAQALGIPGRSSMSKAQLQAAIKKAQS